MIKKKKAAGRQIVRSKKITIDGIQFASTLEGRMYSLLKEAGIKSKYEGKTYTVLAGFEYKSESYEKFQKRSLEMTNRPKVLEIKYSPDFVGENEEWIIEVKGRANESFPLRWKLFKQLMQQRDNPPILFKPSTVAECKQVIEILKDKGYGNKRR